MEEGKGEEGGGRGEERGERREGREGRGKAYSYSFMLAPHNQLAV